MGVEEEEWEGLEEGVWEELGDGEGAGRDVVGVVGVRVEFGVKGWMVGVMDAEEEAVYVARGEKQN